MKTYLDFNSGVVDTASFMRVHGTFITSTSICDTLGNLLFYTNGVNIFNANDDTLLNSKGFNPGFASTINCEKLAYCQGALVIPKPGNDSLYYLFHESGEEFIVYGQYHVQPLELRYSIINMNEDNGRGAMDLNNKTKPLIQDTLTKGFLTAVRHGNGRDWWLIAPRYFSNLYYKYLITNDSISGSYSQNIGEPAFFDTGGGAVFSPDGSIYTQVMNDNKLNIFKFDRCTGMFYDSTYISFPNPNMDWELVASGVAISPNNKFLYVLLMTKIFQFDLQATNIAATQTLVAEWDSSYNPYPTYFFTAQLAPDNKIYIGTWGGNYTLHYIDQPDVQGIGCNVVQNSFPLAWGNSTVPIFPNYDLGAWVGSPCDTLGLAFPSPVGEGLGVRLSPNPASSMFNIRYDIPTNENLLFVLYDSYANEVLRRNLYGTFKNLLVHTEQLPNGIYFWRATASKNSIQANGKIIILQ
ncbi:MAG: hypothetical protein IPO27_10490 [Bacteroidetes bacterium]|nr:hypothetical protein [Bacteroidota bacterium]